MPSRIEIKQSDLTRLIMEPEDVYILNIHDYIKDWKEDKVLMSKLDTIDGVYIKGNPKPLIPFDRTCWVKDNDLFSPVRVLDDIISTNSHVYRGDGEIFEPFMLHSTILKHKDKLTSNPYVNYVHIKFMRGIIDTWIGQMVNYIYGTDNTELRNCLIDPMYVHDILDVHIDALSDLYDDICDFIDDNRWSLYFTRIVGNNIMIERYIDYRIYEWTQEQIVEKDE